MKTLNLHLRQTNQRRINVFYLSPQDNRAASTQMEITKFLGHEDRPRTLREMFADDEVEPDEDL